MFGYVIANLNKLTPQDKRQYQSCYCGLCRTLGKRHGAVSRITLTYDLTFLVLLLSALYRKDNPFKTERCLMRPFKPHKYWRNEITDYAADMNLALAYYNFLDDWVDERKILALGAAKLFRHKYQRIKKTYPRQCGVISNQLAELSEIENSGELNPDIPSNCFGKLIGEIFVFREDENAERLRAFGKSLGKFIYIMDAYLDLKGDLKKKRYNPLVATPTAIFNDILNLLLADCTEKYQKLPLHRDRDLLENILYSGVWTRYEINRKKLKETPR